jgi:predicted metalloprotease
MRWRTGTRSGNVEDRRGIPGGRAGGLGIAGIVIVVVLALVLGINPLPLLEGTDLSTGMTSQPSRMTKE